MKFGAGSVCPALLRHCLERFAARLADASARLGPVWVHEVKFDGYRIQLPKQGPARRNFLWSEAKLPYKPRARLERKSGAK